MATTKTINTRIQLRYDTLENWQSKAEAGKGALLVLNKGEVALCYVPAVVDTETQKVLTAPTVLFKVGDGTGKTFEQLPWGSALAADVYGWAKTPEKPTYTAAEIQGLSDYISGEIQDTDTQYQIIKGADDYTYTLQSKPLGGSSWTDVSTINIPKDTLVEGSTNGAVVFNGDIVHVHGLGSAAYANTGAFDASGAAAGVKTELTGNKNDTWETNKTLNAVHNEAAAAATTASAAQTAAEGAQSTADSALAKANAAMPKVGGDFTNAPTVSGVAVATINTVEDAKSDAIAAAKTYTDKKDGETLQAAKDYADTKTAGLTGAMHFKGVVTGGTLPAASDYAEGDVVLFSSKEYVAYKDGTTMKWAELGDEGSHVLKTQTINGHALSGNIDLTAGDVGAYTKAETNSAITTELAKHAGIDKVGTVTSVATGTGLKVTGTASENPKVEIDDAVIFILNGGSATTVIG